MGKIVYIDHAGNATEVQAKVGMTVMQAATANNIAGIIGDCGGACSCATCHCYVDEAWIDKLDPASEVELSMLDCTIEPRHNSRLACQLFVNDSLDGIIIRLPETQF